MRKRGWHLPRRGVIEARVNTALAREPAGAWASKGQARMRLAHVRWQTMRARRTNELWHPIHDDKHARGYPAKKRNQRTRSLTQCPVPVLFRPPSDCSSPPHNRSGQEHRSWTCAHAARSTGRYQEAADIPVRFLPETAQNNAQARQRLPKRLQPEAKERLHAIWQAESNQEARGSVRPLPRSE